MVLEHLVKYPKHKAEKYPLLLLLHGYGSDEEDLFSFANELPSEYLIISARAPIQMRPYGNAWYEIDFDADENKFTNTEQAIASRDLIVRFVDELIEKYDVDAQNITLIGFSQGAILSYSVALSYPEKIKRVVALSGYLNTNILKENHTQNDFSNLNIFISHGSVDQVIPVEWARKAPDFLSNLGVKNDYHEYPMGHGISPQNFNDFKNFLLNSVSNI
jgi:phospholipase/carboxylesterase